MNKGLKSSLCVCAKIIAGCYFICIGSVSEAWGMPGDKRYYLRNLSIKEGLSQNTVNTVLQDRQGFMWFGTKDGLNRFDGLSLKVFRREFGNPRSIGNNIITTLYEGKDGNLWVGTDAGLYIYRPEKEEFDRFAVSTGEGVQIEETVTMIGNDSVGQIWMAVERQGIFRYDPGKKELRNYPLNRKKTIRQMYNVLHLTEKAGCGSAFLGKACGIQKMDWKRLSLFKPQGERRFLRKTLFRVYCPGLIIVYMSLLQKEG